MSDFNLGGLRSWAKKMKYPDMIDLHRMETSHREIPPRCIPFLQWLTTLSYRNSLLQFDMTPEEFDCKFKQNASTRSIAGAESADTQIEHNSEEEFDSIDELLQELAVIENANCKMKRKIACVTNRIKETKSTSAQNTARNKKKGSHPPDCLKIATEQDLAINQMSKELSSLSLSSKEKFDRLRLSIDEIVDIEMTLLRHMAATSTSAPKQIEHNDLVSSTLPDSSQSPLSRSMAQSLNTSLKCETRSFLALQSGDTPSQEAAAKKLYTNQLQETRVKLLEVFYLAKVQSARTDAEIKFRRGWRRSRGGTEADGMSSSRRSSNMSTCDVTEWGTMSFSEAASPAATKKSSVFNTKTDLNSLNEDIENRKKKLSETVNKKLPIILAIENGYEIAAEITVLQQEIMKQEKVFEELVEQGERYKSLLGTMERFTEEYVRACEDLRTSTILAKQSKLNSVKSTEFIRNLLTDCDMWEKNKSHSMIALQGPSSVQDPRSPIPLWGEESTETGTGAVRKEPSGLSGTMLDDENGVDALGYKECNIRLRGRDSLVFALHSVMTQGGVGGDSEAGVGVGVGRGESGVERGMSMLGLTAGCERRGRVSVEGCGTETTERERMRERLREREQGRETDRSFSRSVDRSTGRSRERNKERSREKNRESSTGRNSTTDRSSDGFYDYFIKDSDTVKDQDRMNTTNRTNVTNITNVLTGTNIIPDETFLGEKIFLSDAVEKVCTLARTSKENRKRISIGISRVGDVIGVLREDFKRIKNSSENLMLKSSKNKGNYSAPKKGSNNSQNKPNLASGNIDNLVVAMKEMNKVKEFHKVELTALFKRIEERNAHRK